MNQLQLAGSFLKSSFMSVSFWVSLPLFCFFEECDSGGSLGSVGVFLFSGLKLWAW